MIHVFKRSAVIGELVGKYECKSNPRDTKAEIQRIIFYLLKKEGIELVWPFFGCGRNGYARYPFGHPLKRKCELGGFYTPCTNCKKAHYARVRRRINKYNKGGKLILNNISYEHFYLPDGRKITKPFKPLLKSWLGKERTDKIFPEFCKQVRELFNTPVKLRADFYDAMKIGQYGDDIDLGDGGSCFRRDGCYSSNGTFIAYNKRLQILGLRGVDDPSQGGRCIVFFEGGRQLILTNFYYSHLRMDEGLFIKAIEELYHVKVIKREKLGYSLPLPIYKNGNAIRLTFERSFTYAKNRIKLTCPICQKEKVSLERINTSHESSADAFDCVCPRCS